MAAVRRPIFRRLIRFRGTHAYDRIEKPADFADHRFEFAGMRFGEIALIRSRFHEIDRQRGEREPMTTVRLPIDRKNFSTVLFDRSMQIGDLIRRRRSLQFCRVEPTRLTGRFSFPLTAGATPSLRWLLRHGRVW